MLKAGKVLKIGSENYLVKRIGKCPTGIECEKLCTLEGKDKRYIYLTNLKTSKSTGLCYKYNRKEN